MTEKTATERLREMLDECGVEWWETINHANCVFTWWESPIFGMVHAMDNEDGETLFMACLNNIDFTPEQAIATTLGSGALTADDVLNAVYKHGARWQAIADELNAALGSNDKSRWHELFGTPERAARTLERMDVDVFNWCVDDDGNHKKCGECPYEYDYWGCYLPEKFSMLVWLKSEVVE